MKTRLLSTLLLLAAAAPSLAEVANPWAPLEALRNLPTIESTGRIEIDRAGRGAWETLPFKLWYAAPGKFRTEVRAGVLGIILTVSDGQNVWSKDGGGDTVVHRQSYESYKNRRDAATDPFTLFLLNRDPLSANWRIEGTPSATSFRLAPLRPRSDLDFLDIRLSSNGSALSAIEAIKGRRATIKIKFDAWSTPASIPAERFAFDPTGLRVNDIR